MHIDDKVIARNDTARISQLKEHLCNHYSAFYFHTSLGKCVYLIVHIDDKVITRNDTARISKLKEHLCNHFQSKDLGRLKYFIYGH